MALTARFVADFTSFHNAVETATVDLKKFESNANQVGRSLNRMVDNFSGRKLIQEATLMATAVEKIGGPSQLTASELQRVASTAAEAAAKLRALGKDVPPQIQALANKVQPLPGMFGTVTSAVGTLAGALGIAFTGTAIVAGIARQVTAALDYADSLSKLRARTELSYRDLQILENVGISTGVSLEALANAVQILQQRLGDGTARKGLEALRLSFDQIKNLSPGEQFATIGAAIAKITDPIDRARVAALVFGRSWKEIVPALRADMSEVARLMNFVGDAQIDAADRAGDRWEQFWRDQKRGWAAWAGDIILNIEKGKKSWDEASRRAAELRGALSKLPTLPTGPSARVGPGAFVQSVDPEAISRLRIYGKTLEDTAKSAQLTHDRHQDAARAVAGLVDKLGGSQSIANAKAWMAALQQIGGLTKISQSDQSELSKTLDAALAAYQRLGVQAPDAMIKLAEASRLPLASTNRLKDAIGKGPASLGGALADTSEYIESYSALLFSTTEHTDAFGRVTSTQAVPALNKAGIEFEKAATKTQKFNNTLSGVEEVLGGIQTAWAQTAVIAVRAIDAISTKLAAGDWVGAIVAAGAAIGNFVTGLFRASEETKRVSPLRDVFFKAAGGLEVLNPLVQKLTGNLRLVQAVFDARTVEQYNQAIAELTALFDFQKAALSTLDETAKKYGLTIEELGPAWQRQELDKKAQELFKDYQVLTSAGVDHVTVLNKMGASINEYVSNALKMGLEVPAAMRPMLEAMVTNGQLLDLNGNKITDLETAGISFAMTMTEGFQSLIKEVQKLTDIIAKSLGVAIKNIPDGEFEIHGKYNLPKNIPKDVFPDLVPESVPMAAGGAGRVTKPTLFLAGEAGPEDFVFSGANRTLARTPARAGGSLTVNVTLPDRRILAKTVVEDLPGVLRELGLA